MKICTKCNINKPLGEFSKDKTKSSGFLPSCKSCKTVYDLKRRAANPELMKEKSKVQRLRHRKKLTQYKYSWRRKNLAYVCEQSKIRYRATKQATPKWLTAEQLKEIKNFYVAAQLKSKETGILHRVDHITPIKGKDISGLHVPWNLRVITNVENSEKSNKVIS